MKHPLERLWEKSERLCIGLMSGTSADGIDAVLVQISGYGASTKVKQLAFTMLPFSQEVRSCILALAGGETGGSRELCQMNFLLGELYAEACEQLCREWNGPLEQIDLIGSHGQTVYHIPEAEPYLGHSFRSTLQIGEASVIAERMGCPVISDFRVRDVAAGGLGAPLVPYTEYLLYHSNTENVGLQNIGGIGNITLLPKGCELKDVVAFDTGPGNMVMDALTVKLTNGRMRFDEGGRMAAQGKIHYGLLSLMMKDPYLLKKPPKTTGREHYGNEYISWLLDQAARLQVPLTDVLTTATRFTAECIRKSIQDYCHPAPDRLIVGGGGSMNAVLMDNIRECLPDCRVLVNEDLGLDSNAKEAVAFALLANEAVFNSCNNAPSATGAKHPVVMGKISLP